MIIVNQDKTEIINFDNTLNISLYPKYDGLDNEIGYEIFAGMKAPDDNYIKLGCYETKERAKEVLQEIIKKYEKIGLGKYFKSPMIVINGEKNFICEMPTE